MGLAAPPLVRSAGGHLPRRVRRIGSLAFALVRPSRRHALARPEAVPRSHAYERTKLRERHEEATQANQRLRHLLDDKHFLLQQVHRSYLARSRRWHARSRPRIRTPGPYRAVAEVALLLAKELELRRDRAACDPRRRRDPRHRQGRDSGRHPPQAESSQSRRAGDHPPASGDLYLHPGRARAAADGEGDGPPSPRAHRRPRLSVCARGRGHPARRTGALGRRRARRDDDVPAVPLRAASGRARAEIAAQVGAAVLPASRRALSRPVSRALREFWGGFEQRGAGQGEQGSSIAV